jgi:hypothetical protein
MEEEVGVDPNTGQGTARFQNGVTGRCDSSSLLISPKVSNLDSLVQNQVSCQLDEGRIMKPICQRTFSFEVSIRLELMTPGYKAGIFPTILRDQCKTKNPDLFLSPGFPLVI